MNDSISNINSMTRRKMLETAGMGFGAVALQAMMAEDARASYKNPLAPKPVHHPPRARNVIFLFMDGGPSHIDTFDPKPVVNQHAGRPMPKSIKRVITPMGVSDNPVLASKRKWRRYGESGLPVSNWYPHVGECADDLCVIRSCWANGLNHVGSVCQMNTGSILAGRPSLGAWVSYGLGSVNQDLPAFVVLLDNAKEPPGGSRVWGTGFMPATYQGTRFRNGDKPILHLLPEQIRNRIRERRKRNLITTLNKNYQRDRIDAELDARIAAYELAYRMQKAAPEAVDLRTETATTKQLYGMDRKETRAFGRNCLLARRLVERGVRFVQLYAGSGSKWDAHSNIEANHGKNCKATDLPIAGLLKDLKQRGMLQDTLVYWGGEFGRTPMSEKGNGRDHNPYGFTMWMAGGGTKGGHVVGATDEFGMHAIEDRAHVHDLHATVLHLLGLDHSEVVYNHGGRPERPTVNEGEVIEGVLA